MERGSFGPLGVNLECPIVTNELLLHICAKVHEPMELSFEVVSGVSCSLGVLEEGPCVCPKGKGVWGILFPHCFGDVIGIFKPNTQNIQMFISWKLLHEFQPNFAQQ